MLPVTHCPKLKYLGSVKSNCFYKLLKPQRASGARFPDEAIWTTIDFVLIQVQLHEASSTWCNMECFLIKVAIHQEQSLFLEILIQIWNHRYKRQSNSQTFFGHSKLTDDQLSISQSYWHFLTCMIKVQDCRHCSETITFYNYIIKIQSSQKTQ